MAGTAPAWAAPGLSTPAVMSRRAPSKVGLAEPPAFGPAKSAQHRAGILETLITLVVDPGWLIHCSPCQYRAQQLAPGDPQVILYVSLQLALVRQVSPPSS